MPKEEEEEEVSPLATTSLTPTPTPAPKPRRPRGRPGLIGLEQQSKALGKLIVPRMRERGITVDRMRQELHIYRDTFTDLMKGKQVELAIAHVMKIAEVVDVDPAQAIAAYLQDVKGFYPQVVLLAQALRSLSHMPEFVGSEDQDIRQQVAEHLYMMCMYQMVPQDRRSAFHATMSGFLEGIDPHNADRLVHIQKSLARHHRKRYAIV